MSYAGTLQSKRRTETPEKAGGGHIRVLRKQEFQEFSKVVEAFTDNVNLIIALKKKQPKKTQRQILEFKDWIKVNARSFKNKLAEVKQNRKKVKLLQTQRSIARNPSLQKKVMQKPPKQTVKKDTFSRMRRELAYL